MPDPGLLLFQAPWALSALALLPGLYWLLRVTPPRPRKMLFPALMFLQDLKTTEDTPHRTPWWLLMLRLAIAALIILAAAGPFTQQQAKTSRPESLTVVIIDTGWAAASAWQQRIQLAAEILNQAQRAGRPVLLVSGAASISPAGLVPVSAAEAQNRLAALAPHPYRVPRGKLAKALLLNRDIPADAHIHWLSDGIDYGQGGAFIPAMQQLAGRGIAVTVYQPPARWFPLALVPPVPKDGDLKIKILLTGPNTGAQTSTLRSFAADGRQLEDTAILLAAGQRQVEAAIQLPLRLRNQITRVEIVGGQTAAGVLLLDDRHTRKPVGLAVAPGQSSLSLLAPLHYVDKAIRPISEIRRNASIDRLANPANDLILLADRGRLTEADQTRLSAWVSSGGTLIRFAGPRMAAGADDLIPVRLRRGGRSLGGALSWDTPQKLAPFDRSSPFAGLNVPDEVTISRQVLAEPSLELGGRTWARLSDGTPLVTAARSGRGWLILFHTTANAEWSNLPLSGLFVQMMHRLISLAPGISAKPAPDSAAPAAQPRALTPVLTLNGYGQLGKPPATATPISLHDLNSTAPGPHHPPGYYGPEQARRAFNLLAPGASVKPLAKINGAAYAGYEFSMTRDLSGYALLAALILFLLDGGLRLLHAPRSAAAANIVIFACLLSALSGLPLSAQAQTRSAASASGSASADEFAIMATRVTHLAYVRTGDQRIDEISRLGLTSLTQALTRRTSFEPGQPMAVDISKDELAFFPFLYWPVSAQFTAPDPETISRINIFMKSGGTILFDSRDASQAIPELSGIRVTASQRRLAQLLNRLDIPRLEPVPANHVLGKSFYLLQNFPGRWRGGPLWTEADAARRISGILVGSNDYAAAWARNLQGSWLFPVSPGGETQRENAIRAGINIVLYALTGNYKADQVHVPAILQRLGR